MKITREHFINATGVEPEQDDLERSNCECAGEMFHTMCGWNTKHDCPNFMVPISPKAYSAYLKVLAEIPSKKKK